MKQKNKMTKKKQTQDEEILFDETLEFDSDEDEIKRFYQGGRELKDFIAPSAFDRGHEDYIRVGEKVVKSYYINGFPNDLLIGWLRELYSYDGNLDIQIFIEPTETRMALDELTRKITQFESQLYIEMSKGNNNITALKGKVEELYNERRLLERNAVSLYKGAIAINLYADDVKELKNRAQKLDHKLKSLKISLMPNTLKHDDGYKSALPFGKNYILDSYRNFNTGGLVSCFPFYNAEMIHIGGAYLGLNLSTGSPVFIDLFDRTAVNNSSATIFGEAGSGKSVLTSALLLRSALRGVRSTIIDPEGEYVFLTERMNGANIRIAPNGDFINVFDIEEEDEYDSDGYPTGRLIVRVDDKIMDLIALINIMLDGEIDPETRSLISFVIKDLYVERGITSDPASLYIKGSVFDDESEELHYAEIKKDMPTFSDFHDKLMEKAEAERNKKLHSIVTALRMFRKEGPYGLFDCQTSPHLKRYQTACVINFDISKLEGNLMKSIGMHVALSFAWDKFGKKNKEQKKLIVVDEAWMLMKDAAEFMENISRRSRKRTCGLIVASQKFDEFAENIQGRAVLTNSATNIFLKSNATDCKAIQETFHLSDGERQFIQQAKVGEALIKTSAESAIMQTHVFKYEESIFFHKKDKSQKVGA